MEKNPVAKYSLELLDNGKYRVSVDWADISNSQLNTFLNAVVLPDDVLINKVRSKIKEAAEIKGQDRLTNAFLKKSSKIRDKDNEPIFSPSDLVQHHFLQSRGQINSGVEDEA